MREVSKEEFFAPIYERKLNVHPRSEADASYYEFLSDRRLYGKTTPGYLGKGRKAYFLTDMEA